MKSRFLVFLFALGLYNVALADMSGPVYLGLRITLQSGKQINAYGSISSYTLFIEKVNGKANFGVYDIDGKETRGSIIIIDTSYPLEFYLDESSAQLNTALKDEIVYSTLYKDLLIIPILDTEKFDYGIPDRVYQLNNKLEINRSEVVDFSIWEIHYSNFRPWPWEQLTKEDEKRFSSGSVKSVLKIGWSDLSFCSYYLLFYEEQNKMTKMPEIKSKIAALEEVMNKVKYLSQDDDMIALENEFSEIQASLFQIMKELKKEGLLVLEMCSC